MAIVAAIIALVATCAAADTSYDFTAFEDAYLQQWLDLFTINAANGS
jgi:hypothetical protein